MPRAEMPGGPDPDYPYPDGSIGVWGYDLLDGRLVDPSTADLMSYCDPAWISDYSFNKAALATACRRHGKPGWQRLSNLPRSVCCSGAV